MKQQFRYSIILLYVGLLGFSSCFVGREYERPDMPTEALYRSDHLKDSLSLFADSSSIAKTSWRELFTDTVLQNYIEVALENNLDIRKAIQSIYAAESYLQLGKASFGPSANASLNYGFTHNPKASQFGDVNNFNLGADLSWEIDIWGKIRSQKKAYEAAYLQTLEAHNGVKTRLIANMARTYYQLISLDDQIHIAERNLAARDSSLMTTKALMQAGQLTAVAIKQTEAQVFEAENILLNLKNQRRTIENTFCLLMSEAPHAISRGDSLDQQVINTPLVIGVPAKLLVNRPDVRQSEYALLQALELTNVAKSNFYPSLVLTAGAGFQATDIKNWLTPEGIFATIAGGLLQPIINKRQIKTAYEVAQTKEQQAFINYEQSLLIAGQEVSDALYNYQTQEQAMNLQEQQVASLRKAVDYSQQLLVNGLANYLEVLTAQQNVLQTELSLSNTRYQRLAAMITLYEALGGGWQ